MVNDPAPVHALVVRITHWITAVAALGLIVSGVAILLAHPRLYWGETGVLGGPSLIDLPIPFWLGHSGWGRYLHFLAAWVSVGCGLAYWSASTRGRASSCCFRSTSSGRASTWPTRCMRRRSSPTA